MKYPFWYWHPGLDAIVALSNESAAVAIAELGLKGVGDDYIVFLATEEDIKDYYQEVLNS